MGGPVPNSLEVDLGDLYEENVDYVWETLRRLGVSPADVEDLCHDVFLLMHRKLKEYDPARPIRPYLFGIGMRLASDYRRSARRRREVLDEVPDHADEGTPAADDLVAATQARRLVYRALDAIDDDDQRAIFILVEIDGVSVPEAASVIDAKENTLYSRLRLARRKFADAVKRITRGAA